jgi:hypothetical protein
MNWQPGPADEVAERLRAQFDATIHSSILKFHPDQHVSELIPGGLGSVRAVILDGVRVPLERRVMGNLEG